MPSTRIEHINISVVNPHQTAAILSRIFDWRIRWEGPSMNKGYTVHVGTKQNYLALYSHAEVTHKTLHEKNSLNHIAIQVDNFDKIQSRVCAEGFKPHNFGDYEPGRRFYFHDKNNIEFEIVSYAKPTFTFKQAMRRQLSLMSQNMMVMK